MKTVFLGNFGARPGVSEAILAKTTEKLDTTVLFDLDDSQKLIPALAEAEIVVSHIWKKDFPAAPRVKLLQSVAAGIDLIDVPSVPPGVSICNVAGHEQAIAEYVLMTMLAWHHRLVDIATTFRDDGAWSSGGGAGGGSVHGEIMGKTVGIVGYGKIGREVAKRAVPFGCRVIAANRSPIADKGDASEIYPLAEVDRMLPLCDVVVIAAGLGPETNALINAPRLALMKPTAFLINIGRAAIADEEALYNALRDKAIGAALDVWWRYPTAAEPKMRPSRLPFHELPNVLMTPHSSSFTEGTAARRFGAIAGNIDRFIRGEPLVHVVAVT
jgi:phosphoglycerate dehydrogenase-like enzyme